MQDAKCKIGLGSFVLSILCLVSCTSAIEQSIRVP